MTIVLNQSNFVRSAQHFNTQVTVFGQRVKDVTGLPEFQRVGTPKPSDVGAGNLYVTVYGGRTRLAGVLPGLGRTSDAPKARLNSVTPKFPVVAVWVTWAVKVSVSKGILNPEDFPLRMHLDGILTERKQVSIFWERFRFED